MAAKKEKSVGLRVVGDSGDSDQADKARDELLAKAKKAVEACSKEIQDALERHGCSIQANMVISQTGNVPQIVVVPNLPDSVVERSAD